MENNFGVSNVYGVSPKDGKPGYLAGFNMSNPVNVTLMVQLLKTGQYDVDNDPIIGIKLVRKNQINPSQV